MVYRTLTSKNVTENVIGFSYGNRLKWESI